MIRNPPALRKPIELPPEVTRRFVDDMLAFHAEENAIKRDEMLRVSCMRSSIISTASFDFPT